MITLRPERGTRRGPAGQQAGVADPEEHVG